MPRQMIMSATVQLPDGSLVRREIDSFDREAEQEGNCVSIPRRKRDRRLAAGWAVVRKRR